MKTTVKKSDELISPNALAKRRKKLIVPRKISLKVKYCKPNIFTLIILCYVSALNYAHRLFILKAFFDITKIKLLH